LFVGNNIRATHFEVLLSSQAYIAGAQLLIIDEAQDISVVRLILGVRNPAVSDNFRRAVFTCGDNGYLGHMSIVVSLSVGVKNGSLYVSGQNENEEFIGVLLITFDIYGKVDV
jgi:hypothetical protein